MGIGEAISKGFSVSKKSMPLVVVMFVFTVAFNLLNLFMTPQGQTANTPPSPTLVIAAVVFLLLSIFFQAGSIGYILEVIKTGASNLGTFKQSGAKFYVKLALLGLIVTFVVLTFVFIALLSYGLLDNLSSVVAALVAILFSALGVYFLVLLFLAPYAAIADEKGIKESIKTSARLVKHNIGPLLGLAIVLVLIAFGIGLLIGLAVAGLSFLIQNKFVIDVVFTVIGSILNSYLGVVVGASLLNFYLSLGDRS